ncbi:hypothetical protein BJ322DRAFT_59391 [Thelephora terrestris]|uniref:Uncharacterized protein n=1 Tax=Thelephora terrestris TaxID=56493 RepID=A0A9P6HPW7_9AGAM|nr:hypothetical protein BJ322DRAFT_59391 [Thelephora terrestris]
MSYDTIISAVVHLLGVSVVSHLISRRVLVDGVQCSLRRTSWPRLCVLIVFLDSYLFLFTTGILILGIGMATSNAACSLGIYLCIVFYGTSKLFIYLFLIERVYVVWRPTPTTPRSRSRVYVVCMALLTLYLGVAGVMFYGNISAIREGICYIGLKFVASAPLLAYDLFITLLLTTLFLWPLLRGRFRNNTIKRLAVRTLISSFIALATSCVNVLVLIMMHGRQLGWVCLGSCSADVVVNALALFWVTDSISERSAAGPRSGAGTLDHPVYEMSSERSHKDTGESTEEMVPTNHRRSRQSWSPLVALDRTFRVLFVREPAPRETDTVDVEIAVHTETNVDISSLHESPHLYTKKGKAKTFQFT